jgi:hypothetical protein
MKIITKDNFDRDLFVERVIAENLDEFIGKQLVTEWNKKYWNEGSDFYLELVERS